MKIDVAMLVVGRTQGTTRNLNTMIVGGWRLEAMEWVLGAEGSIVDFWGVPNFSAFAQPQRQIKIGVIVCTCTLVLGVENFQSKPSFGTC